MKCINVVQIGVVFSWQLCYSYWRYGDAQSYRYCYHYPNEASPLKQIRSNITGGTFWQQNQNSLRVALTYVMMPACWTSFVTQFWTSFINQFCQLCLTILWSKENGNHLVLSIHCSLLKAEEQAQLAARDAINQQNAQQVQAQDAFQGQQRAAGGQGFQFGNPFNFNGKRRWSCD